MKFKRFLILIMVVFLLVQFDFLTAEEEEEPVQARKAWMSLKNSRSLKILKVSRVSKELCRIDINDIKILLGKSGITIPTTVYLRSKSGKIISKLGVFSPVISRKRGMKFINPDNGGGRSIRFKGPGNVRIQLRKFDDPLLFENNSKRGLARKKIFNNYSLVFKNSKGHTKVLLKIGISVDKILEPDF